MKLESTPFAHQATIPKDYTGDGKDISPPLRWSDVPEGTREFAPICDDPHAPSPRRPAPEPWVHWVIYGIAAGGARLPAGLPPKEKATAPSSGPRCRARILGEQSVIVALLPHRAVADIVMSSLCMPSTNRSDWLREPLKQNFEGNAGARSLPRLSGLGLMNVGKRG